MQTEVIRINCNHCRKEYMTPRWNINTECDECQQQYVINSDRGYHVADPLYYAQDRRRATIYTKARAEQHVGTLTTFHVNNNYRVEKHNA